MNNILIPFLTPKKVALNGVWLGNQKAETVYIFLHGLGGSLFSRASLLERLASQQKVAVFTFNNRGFGLINSFKIKKNKVEEDYLLAGMAHEKFVDCIDDIYGAITYVKSRGVKKIILLGHSTGCQKIVYYLAKNTREKFQGVILLAPMSDYSSVDVNDKDYIKAIKVATEMKESGRANDLLPLNIWPRYISAQRFLSLYSASSIEEIFDYASSRRAALLKKISQPLLILLAENDEFADRPMKDIKDWFDEVLKKKNYQSYIINGASHSFEGSEQELCRLIHTFLK